MTATNNRRARAAIAISVVLGISVISSIIDIISIPEFSSSYIDQPLPRLRRALQSSSSDKPQRAQQRSRPPSVYPWARSHLRPLESIPDPEKETVLFWHIPKSGGTTLKSIYECLGRTIAKNVGVDPRYGHDADTEIVAFQPWAGVSAASYVNVDTTTKQGIDRARKMGLVPSGLADMIITSDPEYAVSNLYDVNHKGRVLALFRHPVERLVSKFYYLQKATWEKQYRPQWKRIDVLEFAKKRNTDNNHMVKKLAGLGVNETATNADLQVAMRTIKKRFIVGLTDQMEESLHRFNIVMGINEDLEDINNRQCIEHFVHHSVAAKKHSENPHPKVEEGSATWNAIVKRNALDVRLYEFVVKLFEEQRDIIEMYARDRIELS